MSNLPRDLIPLILSKLPAKSLLRFRCVSKSWFSLIRDPNFVKMHLHHSTLNNNNNPNFMLSRMSKLYSIGYYDTSSSFAPAIEIDYPDNYPQNWVRVFGSCNGLLFIHTYRINAIWNPSTQEFKILPETSDAMELSDQIGVYSDLLFGFGYDSTNDDYKVVRIVQYYELGVHFFGAEAQVYTLGTNSWHRVDNVDFCTFWKEDPALSLDGTINWLAKSESLDNELIVSFDVMGEKFLEIPTPEFVDNIICLSVSGGNLCLLNQFSTTQADMWLMKEYGLKESWTKLFTISQLTGIQPVVFLRVLCFSNTGEVLLLHNHKELLLYNPKLKKAEILPTTGTPGYYFKVNPYVGSLVSLKSGTYVGGKQAKRKRTQSIGGAKMRKNATLEW